MGLTQVGSGGIKDDAITDAKLPANSVGNSEMKDDAVGVAELSATGTASNSTFLRGDNSWQTVSTSTEGEDVTSTTNRNEANTKFLRADGDGTCSWQVPPDTNTTYSIQDGELSQNNFTNADHTKLNGIEASATADQTGAEIKSAYEGEADTNAYTDAEKTKLAGIAASAEVNVQSDWNASSGDAQILNKPTIPAAQVQSDWNATSGLGEVLNKPTIPSAQVSSDWNSTSSPTEILNKPTVPTVTGSTNNTITTVTGANAIQGEANLTFDGTKLLLNQANSDSRRVQIRDEGWQAGLSITRNSADNGGPNINLRKSRATGDGNVTIVQDDDQIGSIDFYAADGTDYVASTGGIASEVDGTPGADDMPGRLVFKTTADGAYIPTERLRVDSSGRLIQRFSAAPYDNRAATFQSAAGIDSTYIAIVNTETDGTSGILFGDHAAQDAGNYTGYISYHHTDNTMRFMANGGTERFRIESGGNVKIDDGNLVIGTSGHGIDFSATANSSGSMDSELLDDYEKGEWTPTITGWDTVTPYSGSNYHYGWYVKVGRAVLFGWKVYMQTLSTVSTDAKITMTGLPFTGGGHMTGPIAHFRFDIPEFGVADNNYWSYMPQGSSYFYNQKNSGGTVTNVDATSNYSNVWTMGSGAYMT